MDFAFDQRTEQLRTELLAFMDEHVYPAEPEFERSDPGQPFSWERPKIMAELRAEARRRGLWNLFLPDPERGAGLTNLQYAPLAEITGRSPHVAPEAVNCNAPDTGNMELLHLHGTPEQQERWLEPLLEARIRSGFCMTEPDVASSDASNIALRMTPTADGGFVLNGRKWWTTGALSGDVAVLLVMGVSEPDAPRHERHTILLVPKDSPGVQVKRGLSVFGFWDETHGGHAEVVFDDVRVGPEALLGERGRGFALAQARLGPGRIHHCMRLIGMAERAFDLMCHRVVARVAFGRPLAEQGVVQETIADCRDPPGAAAAAGAALRVADRHRGGEGGRERDLGDQDRGTGDRAVGDRQGDRRPRCRGSERRLPAGHALDPGPQPAVRRRPGRGAPDGAGPPRAQAIPVGNPGVTSDRSPTTRSFEHPPPVVRCPRRARRVGAMGSADRHSA